MSLIYPGNPLVSPTMGGAAEAVPLMWSETFSNLSGSGGFDNAGWTLGGGATIDGTTGDEWLRQTSITASTVTPSHDAFTANAACLYVVLKSPNTSRTFTEMIGWGSFYFGTRGTLGGFVTGHGGVYDYILTYTANTIYHWWFEYKPGSGSNGELLTYYSTDGVKPSSPNYTQNDGAGTTYPTSLEFRSLNTEVLYDNIAIGNSPMGNSPLGAHSLT